MTTTVATVPQAKLHTLSTEALIDQYEAAISSHAGRHTSTGPRQKRINIIVDLLAERADQGDQAAIEWLAR